jgi:hypothetical protein
LWNATTKEYCTEEDVRLSVHAASTSLDATMALTV